MDAKKTLDLTQEPGIRHAAKIFGEESAQKLADFWSDYDEHFARTLCNYAYGEMYGRTILSQKQRELCAVASLTSLGKQKALAFHIKAALHQGASREEVVEVICQVHIYAGIPCLHDALETYKLVIEELKT